MYITVEHTSEDDGIDQNMTSIWQTEFCHNLMTNKLLIRLVLEAILSNVITGLKGHSENNFQQAFWRLVTANFLKLEPVQLLNCQTPQLSNNSNTKSPTILVPRFCNMKIIHYLPNPFPSILFKKKIQTGNSLTYELIWQSFLNTVRMFVISGTKHCINTV
jgi:hypothetical protein